jgi:hypothetical protein
MMDKIIYSKWRFEWYDFEIGISDKEKKIEM